MNPNIEFSIKTAQAYNAVCKPLCQELGLSQQVTAGVQMHCRENQILDFGKETPCHEQREK